MKKYLFLLFIFTNSVIFSQIKMTGKVTDSIGTPLELANVILINSESNSLETFAMSDDKGNYKLSLKKNTSYNLQVSYIGMSTFSQMLMTKDDDILKNFSLQSNNQLDAVELIYEMPVVISGDTLVYDADSFKTGTERKLEDVLKNLPGVEINDDGEIEVEGKAVTKVMVEGKDFFDGDSKIASKNIPSNAVDKVQILKNYAEVGQLSSVQNNQDNIAINIKLKKGKDKFWFGNILAGSGESPNYTQNQDLDLYIFQPKLFFYSPTYSINVIGDLNNIGEQAFTRRDYWNFSGGFNRPSGKSGTNISLGNNNLSFLQLQNNRAKDINTEFIAINSSFSPSKKLDYSAFLILTNSETEIQQNNSTQYVGLTENIPDENTQTNTSQTSELGIGKFSLKFNPNVNNQVDYEVLGRVTNESQDQNYLSSVIGSIEQLDEAETFSINQNLNYYYTLNEKNIFALEAQHQLKDEDPFYNALLENNNNYQTTAIGLGLDNSLPFYNIAQDKRVKSNQLDAKVDYWNILNKKSDLNLTLGTIYSKQDFDSEIFQYLSEYDENIYNPTSLVNDGFDSNDVSYLFNDLYLGLHYRLKTGKFTISPGFTAHSYNSENNQSGSVDSNFSYKKSFFKILPDFNMIIQLKDSESLRLNYAMRTQFTDITKIARGLVLNNYNSLFIGTQDLQNAVSHNISLNYYSFNLFNYTNVYAGINYNKSIDQIRNLTSFESVIATSNPFNSSFADENLSVYGRYQRSYGKIRGTLGTSLNLSKFNQFIRDTSAPSLSETFSQSYNSSIRTLFKNAPNIEAGIKYSISETNIGSLETKYFTESPFVELDALILKSFTFRTNYSTTKFKDQNTVLNNYKFFDASLSYRTDKESKWEFEIKATNLLDTKSQSQSSVSNISVSTSEYFIQPRFITLRLIYT
ncbi:MAG: carboxypeptidase regulatory-like domain-containing protein, partial [Flavobacteriaceae bacterium]|nr:carboxypeptidase regulatory-like domain-containing protein [Flavobacteriaceae bacterium]